MGKQQEAKSKNRPRKEKDSLKADAMRLIFNL